MLEYARLLHVVANNIMAFGYEDRARKKLV